MLLRINIWSLQLTLAFLCLSRQDGSKSFEQLMVAVNSLKNVIDLGIKLFGSYSSLTANQNEWNILSTNFNYESFQKYAVQIVFICNWKTTSHLNTWKQLATAESDVLIDSIFIPVPSCIIRRITKSVE